jgi:predicted  nucleic acid-binding Zn-ribbon protein
MNTKKAVYNKLFSKKTELKTHKVELGLIDDIRKLNDDFAKIFSEDLKLRTEMSKLNRKAKDLDKLYKSKVNNAKKIANEATKKINDLGLKEPAPLIALYDSFQAEPYKDIISQIK